jgi:hypothetical protein
MDISVSQNIISSRNETPGLMVGIAQVREERGARVTKEGAVIIVQKDAKGNEVRCLVTPDEAREWGAMLITASYQAAGCLMPTIAAVPATEPSPLIVGGT